MLFIAYRAFSFGIFPISSDSYLTSRYLNAIILSSWDPSLLNMAVQANTHTHYGIPLAGYSLLPGLTSSFGQPSLEYILHPVWYDCTDPDATWVAMWVLLHLSFNRRNIHILQLRAVLVIFVEHLLMQSHWGTEGSHQHLWLTFCRSIPWNYLLTLSTYLVTGNSRLTPSWCLICQEYSGK